MDMSDNNDLFRLALSAHRRAGHDAGYARAVADMLAASVFVAEGVLRDADSQAEARALLYRFVAALEVETRRRSVANDEVSDGLGI